MRRSLNQITSTCYQDICVVVDRCGRIFSGDCRSFFSRNGLVYAFYFLQGAYTLCLLGINAP